MGTRAPAPLRPMAYQVLARKYRPQRFSDVVGQDHVTRTLLNALAQDRIAHGYIFSGHRGIGKTTIARILASALNCQREIGSPERPTPEPCLTCASCLEIRSGNSVDMLEIDAATNRGIDEIRELRDAARYRPARDRFKIILLDEAHQITDAAFNALLKTLEEPPEHIVFMMATTQPEDIPQTIRSRCQHFSFHAVKLDDIVGQLRRISLDENIEVDDPTLGLLAEAGDGSMRDALSIMDQAIASAPQAADGRPHVELAEVRSLMGAVSNVVFEDILAAVHANDSASVLSTLGTLLDAGNGPQAIARQFVRFLRNCVVARITALDPDTDATGIAAELLQISAEERRRAARAAANFSEEELSRFLSILLRTFDDLGFRQEQRLHLELGMLKLVHVQRLVPVEELLSQLGTNGSGPKPPRPPSAQSAPRPTPTAPTRTQAASQPPAPRPVSPAVNAAQRPAPSSMQAPGAAPEQTRSSAERPEPAQAAPGPPTPPSVSAVPRTESPSPAEDLASVAEPSAKIEVSKASPEPTASEAALTYDFSAEPAAREVPRAPEPPQPAPAYVREQPTPAPARAAATPEPAPKASEGVTADSNQLAKLQAAVVGALNDTKGQTSAADQLEDAEWTLNGNTIEIQTTLSKTMLPMMVNAEANRIITATLRAEDAGHLQIKLLPGAPANGNGAAKKARPAASGSAAELAEKHPLVQEARRLFSAEISKVIDLRDKA